MARIEIAKAVWRRSLIVLVVATLGTKTIETLAADEIRLSARGDGAIGATQFDGVGRGATASAGRQQPARQLSRSSRKAGERLAARLARESQDSFNRGLMSLPDYADQLAVVLKLNIAVAGLNQQNATSVKGLAQRASLLKQAVTELEKFHQPASKGWAADVGYAKLMAAEADMALIRSGHALGSAAKMSRIVGDLAWRHFELRLADYKIGHATLPQMSRAASHLSDDGTAARVSQDDRPRRVDLLSDYHQRLSSIVKRTGRLADRKAGLGRDDRLHLAKYELARTTGMLAAVQGDEKTALDSMSQADQQMSKVFQSQLRYYDKGTSSLFDLTQTWWQRELLQSQMKKEEYDQPVAAGQRANLRRLSELAENETDLRGRHAADVTTVRSLNFLQRIRSIQASDDS